MPFETKSTLDDKSQYFKNLIVINLSAFILITWVIISGWFSSFYCVVSAANVINACLSKVNNGEETPLDEVPWHHEYNTVGTDGKSTTLNSNIAFDEAQKAAFNDTFFKRRADKYAKDYAEGTDSIFISKMWVQLCSIIPRLVSHDLWFISEWHSFFEKIGVKIGGWSSILMTSWIGFPIFILCYALFNVCASLYAWGESVFALYSQLNIYKEVKDDIANTTGNIDCSVWSIIKNAIILFCYAFIVPLIGLLTLAPTLIWLAVTLLFAPLYAFCLPFNIKGMIKPKGLDDESKATGLSKLFAIYNVVLSNIYSFAGQYLIAFSIIYSIVAGIKQDVYAFIGCLIAVLIIFAGLKWYKSAAPDIPEPGTGGGATSVPVTSVVLDQSKDSGIKVVEDGEGDLTMITDKAPVVSTISSSSTPDAANQSAQETVVTPDVKPVKEPLTEVSTEVPTEVPTNGDVENKEITTTPAEETKGGASHKKNKSAKKR